MNEFRCGECGYHVRGSLLGILKASEDHAPVCPGRPREETPDVAARAEA